MISIFIKLLIMLVVVSCSNQNNIEENAILEKNKNIVRKTHEEVWSKGNVSIIKDLYSRDYIAHWVSGDDTNLDELTNMILEARSAFPDLNEEIIHIIAEDDLVVTHFISSGTLKGSLNGFPPTGKKGSRSEIAVHRIENGKIVEQWTVADLLSLLNQLGIEL